jgi:photosystem II stability/assembly factor-like uncharacterized protein
MRKNLIVLLSLVFPFLTPLLHAQENPQLFSDMRWRMIGPHRGGRTVGAVGVPQLPGTFYIGVNNGGVWKTTDYGRTWFPIFDDQPTGSIGDVAVAPDNPDIIYVGTGEGLQRPDLSVGNGMYKSTDAGKTWKHIGLEKVQQIGGIAIDPYNELRVFVAALGHPYGPNEERGVYRTLDGGVTWEKVLYIDENTGAIQVTIDPNNPQVVFADLWAGRQGPWENGAWNGKESGLFKSTDGGNTWRKITNGLPTTEQGLGRIGFCLASSDPKRMYATVDAGREGGIYRSDDAGESWKRIQTDTRLWGRGNDFAEIKADPRNPDIVYIGNVAAWKSIDGGMNWSAFRGAPGGDDYHRIWIHPDQTGVILLATDQGAIITVNGGETFSSWYNQPTAQFYHVSTDNAFPYNVYGGQQESGSVGIASRGNDGSISYREWHPVGAEEYAYVAPDPLDPHIIYGGKISRYDKRTGQTQQIAPEAIRSGKYRFLRTAPVLFNPVDKKTLYYAGNVLFKTINGGRSWEIISPDLSRQQWEIPASVGIYTKEDMKKMPRRGVIYTVAPSYKDARTIWCGTDDGLIHLTQDGGKTWKNVTGPEISSWSKVSLIDAGRFNPQTAYAAVNRIRCDDMRPYIFRTHDGGRTWKKIVRGLPEDPINAVREDPQVKGLLFAGSEKAVYVSFDDGEHWQSLRLNMPATSIRDLVIKDDDLVVGTHGRSFWILDNITPLRDIANIRATKVKPGQDDILYKPQPAYRVRWGMYTDTPIPQEEPMGENPPDGAIIDYYLANKAENIRLEILKITSEKGEPRNVLVRKYSNKDSAYQTGNQNFPPYWIRPQKILSAEPGHHRFTWDMRLAPLNVPPSYPIGAIYHNTAPEPTSPWVMPGMYVARLIVDFKILKEFITIIPDPRVKTSRQELQNQYDLSLTCYNGRKACLEYLAQVRSFRVFLQSQLTSAELSVAEKLGPLERQAALLENTTAGSNEPSFIRLSNSFATVLSILQDSDEPPTNQVKKTVGELNQTLFLLKNKWEELKAAVSTNH